MARPDGSAPTLVLNDDRFARLEAISWWDQPLLQRARVLVIGAGAIGNETIKNLCLLGIGHLVVVDMDRIETSNLSRSVLFRAHHAGAAKAEVAVAAARELYPGIDARAVVGNVLADAGLGLFRWAQVVLGCLDNREARVFVNQACAQVGRPWIDGGIEVLGGVVRGFAPPQTACYECTMGQADWDQLNKRRSCSLLARRAMAVGGTPTTPTTASVIGALQVQELVKQLHGLAWLAGRGWVLEGLHHSSYPVDYPIAADCPWHEPPPPVHDDNRLGSASSLREVWRLATAELGALDALDLSREIVERLDCPGCGRQRQLLRSLEQVSEADAVCADCGAESVPIMVHSLAPGSPLLERSAGELGLPLRDILWARTGERVLGIELAGDPVVADQQRAGELQ